MFENTVGLGLVLFAITFAEGLVMLIKGASEKVRLAAAQDILSRAGDDAVTELDLKENALNVNITVVE